VASHIAIALKAGRLILMTDVDGVMDADKQLISSVDSATIEAMIADQRITGGMIPKIECAVEALRAGVTKVPIINGKRRHAILLELFTDEGIGTEVTL
jgi:acetylglutamate kinase